MISCRDAKHLFGRYLDGELTPTLQTELHAHRLHCTDCQNELALLEACGDVVALERREPSLSASFTDRVLLARRAQARPMRRNWSRTLLVWGSPLAAAACIALMLSVIRPTGPGRSAVAGLAQAAPTQIQEILREGARPRTDQENRDLAATPVMPADGFVEALLAPVVEKSKTTAESARRSAEGVLETLRAGLSSTNETLVAQWRSRYPDAPAEPVGPPLPAEQNLPGGENTAAPSPTGDPVTNPL